MLAGYQAVVDDDRRYGGVTDRTSSRCQDRARRSVPGIGEVEAVGVGLAQSEESRVNELVIRCSSDQGWRLRCQRSVSDRQQLRKYGAS